MGGNPHEHLGALQPAKGQQIRALAQPKQSECTAGDTLLHLFPPVKQRIASGTFALFGLDECTYLLHFGWLESAEVLVWIAAHQPLMLHLSSRSRARTRPRRCSRLAISLPRCARARAMAG